MKQSRYEGANIPEAIRDGWNARKKLSRGAGIAIGILMIVVGIICCVFPIASVYVMEIFAAIIILIWGIYQVVAYAGMPAYFRSGALLACGIINILIAMIMLMMPASALIVVFGFLLAVSLLVFGIEQISVSGTLRYYGAQDSGWLIFTGILSIIVAVIFIFAPFVSAAAMSYLIACYLIVGGIALLVESIKTKSA